MMALWPQICTPNPKKSGRTTLDEMITEDDPIDTPDQVCHTSFIDSFIYESIGMRFNRFYSETKSKVIFLDKY